MPSHQSTAGSHRMMNHYNINDFDDKKKVCEVDAELK